MVRCVIIIQLSEKGIKCDTKMGFQNKINKHKWNSELAYYLYVATKVKIIKQS